MSSGDLSVLLSHHLKALKLPVFLREHKKVAAQCAKEKHDSARFLLELSELELIDREKKGAERRIREAGFPVLKTLDNFDFTAIPSLNKRLVMELARCEYLQKQENVLAVGNSGTGKTHIAIALGLSACQEGRRVKFFTAAGLVTVLTEARDDKALLRFKKQLARKDLVIVDEFGYVPFSKTGAELLFEFFAERYERGSVMVTTNLPFDQWTEVLGSERLTGALLDRLTHRVHILEMNGESYRFRESARRLRKKPALQQQTEADRTIDKQKKPEEES
jgi:DNA replication protein DnaC